MARTAVSTWAVSKWAWSVVAVTLAIVCAAAGLGVRLAAAEEPKQWFASQGAKPLQISLELDPLYGPPSPEGTSYVATGDLIRMRLDWRLRPNRDLLEARVQFKAAPKPAPAVRLWADTEQLVEVFAETTGVGGSQPTLFDLADLPASLWVETSGAGRLKLEMQAISR